MTTAEQTVAAWATIGILCVVMGTAGLDLSARVEALHRPPLGVNTNNYTNVFDRRSWQRWIALTLIVWGTVVTVEALIRLYLFTRS